MTPSQEEVLAAIARCREKKLLEGDVISTGTLTKELNSRQTRSRDWDAFEIGILMAELGFAMSVTPTTQRRGWLVKEEQVATG